MKKLLLATMLSMAATAVYAEPTAMLKVHGTLTSAGCTPELSNGGEADFGEVGLDSLTSAVPYQAGYKDVTLTIKCQSATRVGWNITDNQTSSNAGGTLTSTDFWIDNGTADGQKATGRQTLNGVGKTSAGENIGAYAVSTYLNAVTADGATAQPIASSNYKGTTISSSSWKNMWANGMLKSDGTDVMTVSKTGARAPVAFVNAVFPLKVALAVAPSDTLTLTDKTELDGQSTITLVYL